MSGIAGFYLRDGEPGAATLERMCGAIRHRGPDGEDYFLAGGCGLGIRRLNAIGLESGGQPIAGRGGRLHLVLDGTIYNCRELREQLSARGRRFTTRSDTEVLERLYEEEGVQGVGRLRGPFACAIWDAPSRRLTLARDRLGKKPLYYAATPRGLYFASELKCFRGLDIDFELDRDALRLYFQFGYIPEPRSPFKAVRKLLPGSWLSYDDGGGVCQDRYWRLPPPTERPPAGLDIAAARERLRELFDEAVRVRMSAGIPLGAFLSGGIDSSSVVASMALQSPEPVKTFSIGFEESAFDELAYARLVAGRWRTEHHEMVVKPDSIELAGKLASHLDEPFADASAIPTYIVSEFAARHVKAALTGDGGDELFAGYESFFRLESLRPLDRLPQALRRFIARVSETLPYRVYGKNYLWMISRPTALERYFEFNHTPYFLRRELLEPEWMLPAEGAFLQAELADCLLPGEDALTQAMYFEQTAKLAGDMLVKTDRMSMAASLEVRCPLMDHRLAEFAAALPHSWKMDRGVGKALFRQALGGRLPPEILRRGKMGFGVPLPVWFRGPLREMLWDSLLGVRFLGRGIARPEFVRYLLEEHQRGRRDNSIRLWMLLMLDLWFEQWGSELRPSTPPPAARGTRGTGMGQ
ncbi:MAG: asparagine synthase (glutamine-hydrolyzing) [Bryobacterales bacterium]|nr:asparagine synthase (glutamine-hydrolyzing) [Bryobacterales bacterium]